MKAPIEHNRCIVTESKLAANISLDNLSSLFILKLIAKEYKNNPAGNYMFTINNRNTSIRCEICS